MDAASDYQWKACRTDAAWKRGQRVLSARPHTLLLETELPTSFWWGNVSGLSFLTPVRQQHLPSYCGSCWAFGTTVSLSDRLKIARARAWPEIILAPQVLINCNGGGSCNGGDPTGVYEYIAEHGIPDETCQAYTASNGVCSPLGICDSCSPGRDGEPFLPGTCAAVPSPTLYGLSEYGNVVGEQPFGSNAFAIKAEIYARGPVACDISVTQRFELYQGGVFSQQRLLSIPNHIIAVTGWGVTQYGTEYWIARNSWGSSWGESGFVRVQMHKDNLGIERGCTFGVPTLPSDEPKLHFSEASRIPLGALLLRGAPLATAAPVRHSPRLHDPAHPCLQRRPGPRSAHIVTPLPHTYLTMEALPSSYDIRNVSGINYASVTRNQHIPHYCGSCWSHSTASALSDRIALVRGNAFPEVVLAPQVLVDCVQENSHGCSGGDPNAAFEWLMKHPITDESCSPYLATDDVCTPATLCSDCSPNPLVGCKPRTPQTSFTVSEHGTAFGEHQMMAEIAARGPVVCGICVTDDFESYAGGVFRDNSQCKTEMHAISIAGWGADKDGTAFWVLRNSWGSAWGEQGWAKLQRGVDSLGIESIGCDWGAVGELPTWNLPA